MKLCKIVGKPSILRKIKQKRISHFHLDIQFHFRGTERNIFAALLSAANFRTKPQNFICKKRGKI